MAKAGHRGRCPTCGGQIKVPNVEVAEPMHDPGENVRRLIHSLTVIVVVSAVIGILAYAVIRLGASGQDDNAAPPVVQKEHLVKKLENIRARMVRLDDVEDRIQGYQHMIMNESKLRARDVRTRLNAYEPVSAYECQLREKALTVRASADSADSALTRQRNLRMNTPLSTLEKDQLNQLSDELEKHSAELAQTLRRTRVVIKLTPDPLGRRLLPPAIALSRIERERERLKESEADVRMQMAKAPNDE